MAASDLKELPLIAIVGPTASGKTALAITLAKRFNGEIICADSRTIYKSMDIGTAKPTTEEQTAVPHWGLNLVEPGERFTAADFKAYANQKVSEIRDRGNIPFLVGGTGLYVDAILFDYEFGGEYNPKLRTALEAMTIDELHHYCRTHNVEVPENVQNKRYVIRAIERRGVRLKRRAAPIKNAVVVGIATTKETLRRRIVERTEQLFANGVVKEATLLGEKYGWKSEGMTGNVYPILQRYLLNEIDLLHVKELITTADWQLAKRQLTWLRRNSYIHWLTLTEAESYLQGLLANK